MATRIVIVDDHPLFRGALAHALNSALVDAEILEAGSLDELNGLLASHRNIDLILLDLTMPGVQGLSGLLYLRAVHPEIPVVVVSASEDASTIRNCMGVGASGFVPKSQPVGRIREAVAKVIAGELWTPPGYDPAAAPREPEVGTLVARLSTLTPQQMRVLMMLDEGLQNKVIAYKLGVSEATIKAHVSAILEKLGVDNRTQAVIAVRTIGNGDQQRVAG